MPVAQPDGYAARRNGKEIAKEILGILEKNYHISPPLNEGTLQHFPACTRKCSEEKQRAISQIVSGIIDLCVWDAYESF